MSKLWLIVALILVAGCVAEREIRHEPLADGAGLAAKYPGDQGIEQDSAVIFAEDFEQVQLASLVDRFTYLKHPTSISIVRDSPPMSPGRTSLRITSIGGVSTGGTLYKKLSKGYDLLYLRYYINFPSGGTYHHTSAWLGGYNPPSDLPLRNAGIKPLGHDYFSIAAEPVDTIAIGISTSTGWGCMGGTDGLLGQSSDLRSYTHTHKRPLDLCGNYGQGERAGHGIEWRTGPMDRWDSSESSGAGISEGKLEGRDLYARAIVGEPFEGFQWRNDPALQLNWFTLQHYVTDDPPEYVGHVLFDHVVLATSRIGCLSGDTHSPTDPVTSKNE